MTKAMKIVSGLFALAMIVSAAPNGAWARWGDLPGEDAPQAPRAANPTAARWGDLPGEDAPQAPRAGESLEAAASRAATFGVIRGIKFNKAVSAQRGNSYCPIGTHPTGRWDDSGEECASDNPATVTCLEGGMVKDPNYVGEGNPEGWTYRCTKMDPATGWARTGEQAPSPFPGRGGDVQAP
ncbi:MAG: hypothetical protein A3J74_06635 [Elusimicrobia bacterium RIFCSPHIGHO2_02_FULL_57_9]|nr:MAG: hypothetical protein A3J74_06635 [Elusimicrobia bacterium RIFCSPHIGHO2_02_FULL_57_9]